MPQYQLIVQRAYYKGQQKTYAIDLDGDTIEEARLSARTQLYGNPDNWRGKLVKGTFSSIPELEVHLNAEDEDHPHYGFLMGVGDSCIPIQSATIVESTGETLDIPAMQKELDHWTVEERRRLLADPEYQEMLRLQAKFAS